MVCLAMWLTHFAYTCLTFAAPLKMALHIASTQACILGLTTTKEGEEEGGEERGEEEGGRGRDGQRDGRRKEGRRREQRRVHREQNSVGEKQT